MGNGQERTTVGYYGIFTDEELAKQHEQFSPMKDLAVGE
jgi:hypothetical protein